MEGLIAIIIVGVGLTAMAIPQIIRDRRADRERRARAQD